MEVEIRRQWVRQMQMRRCSPTSTFIETENNDAKSPYVRYIREGILTLAIWNINHNTRMKRILFDLVWRQHIRENMRICIEIKNHNFRRTKLTEIRQSFHDTGINDPQTITFIDKSPVDIHEFRAIGIRG